MAIYFETSKPGALHAAFDLAIDDGSITTWEYDKDGDYTHKALNWAKNMWLRPIEEAGKLSFYTLPRKDKKIDRTNFAYYHGHLIETFINHFSDKFSVASATPSPAGKDKIE